MHIKAMNKKKVKRPPLDQIPPEFVPFIKACWAQDPSTRPTFVEIKAMLNTITIDNPVLKNISSTQIWKFLS